MLLLGSEELINCSMRKILFLYFSIVSVCSFAQATQKQKSKFSEFYLEYTSATKTILIRGTSIIIQEWIEQFDNPISSMPSSRKEISRKGIISNTDLQALQSLIKSSAFMTLPKIEYGASKEERHYPYTLIVKQNGREKKVLYRSNPAPEIEQMPKAFDVLEKKVSELAANVKE
jgi:hypothetical protein